MFSPRTALRTTAAAAVAVAGALATGASAHAEGTWFQSYERGSQTATCDAPPIDYPVYQDTWNPADMLWNPSYEMWANGGTGGWTCNRNIVWQPPAPTYPSAGCLPFFDDAFAPSMLRVRTVYYAQFGGGWAVGRDAPRYTDSSCSVQDNTVRAEVVYAPAGWSADALCREAFPDLPTYSPVPLAGNDTYFCNVFI